MASPKLDIAFWNYDRTRLLADGTVKIDGVDATFHSARIVPKIFEAMIRRRAYDVSELGMTYFLRTFGEDGRSPFVAIPVFLARSFRHGAIYINKASGIETGSPTIGVCVMRCETSTKIRCRNLMRSKSAQFALRVCSA